jgi:hypothetical protein
MDQPSPLRLFLGVGPADDHVAHHDHGANGELARRHALLGDVDRQAYYVLGRHPSSVNEGWLAETGRPIFVITTDRSRYLRGSGRDHGSGQPYRGSRNSTRADQLRCVMMGARMLRVDRRSRQKMVPMTAAATTSAGFPVAAVTTT